MIQRRKLVKFYKTIFYAYFFFLDLSNLVSGTIKSENVSSDEINDGEIEITFLKFNLTTIISELHRKIVLGRQL